MSHTHKPYGQHSGAVRYAECLKNHATAVGGAATDGCREFMTGGPEGTIEALKCAACDCHRNFHRKIRLHVVLGPAAGVGGRPEKRIRTKFSGEQKEKMLVFAERAGWRLSGVDDGEVRRFCEEIGVSRKVLRVWVHNNKYRSVKKNKNTSCS